MFCQGSGCGFHSGGGICQVCGPLNQHNAFVCQPDSSQGTWYIIHNLQLFNGRRGKAIYPLWSIAVLL
eukprot:9913322-Ditylum_brightwellii.AAC.1